MGKKYETYKDIDINWIKKIPSHWEEKSLRKYLHPISEKNHPEATLLSVTREKGVIIRDVDNKDENHNYVPDDLSNYKFVKKGQFVINKMKSWQGSYGVSRYDGIVSPAYYVFDLDFINKDFFEMALRSKAYVPFFTKNSTGIRVGQWDLDLDKLKNIPLYVPPKSEQDKIVRYLNKKTAEIDDEIDKLKNKISLLEELRTKLIADVVTGQIDVRDVVIPD